MPSLATVILAAGKGTRMASSLPKVIHSVAGQPMISYPLNLASQLGSKKTVVVLGHAREAVENYVISNSQASCVKQNPQLGTGHAVAQTEKILKNFKGDVLILYGDVPLIQVKTIKTLLRQHQQKNRS